MASELEEAWDTLRAATPAGWTVGRPAEHLDGQAWWLYAFDPSVRGVLGVHDEGRIVRGSTEVEVVRELTLTFVRIREGTGPH
jgi:hypothetical protein